MGSQFKTSPVSAKTWNIVNRQLKKCHWTQAEQKNQLLSFKEIYMTLKHFGFQQSTIIDIFLTAKQQLIKMHLNKLSLEKIKT